jgi:hypothetical protein
MAFCENRLGCSIIFVFVVLLCFLSLSPAEGASETEFKQEDPAPQDEKRDTQETLLTRKKNFITILGGAVYWKNLGDLEHTLSGSGSGQFGDFKEWGYNIEIAYHRLITQWLGNDIQLGMDFGIFFNENERDFQLPVPPGGETVEIDLNSRGLYLTPSVRMVIGKHGSTRVFLGAGVGLYMVDFVEQLPDGDEIYEFAEKETIGGYLSAGVGFPLSPPDRLILRIEGKVHFVNFGELGGFAPGAGDLKGPVYIFQAGITF